MTDPQWTWERLSDFFAGGGKISLPSCEDLCRDSSPAPLPRFRWFAGMVGDERSMRPLTDEELERMNAAERWREAIQDRVRKDMPFEVGLDLARGMSEAWLIRWDWGAGKMVYRKLDPADMVRRDDEGKEGIGDGQN